MHGILIPDLIAALAAAGIERGVVPRHESMPIYRAVVWPSVCGQRESQAAQRLAARGYATTGMEALARVLLDALGVMRVAQARELAVA